jgi:hypothetical protein
MICRLIYPEDSFRQPKLDESRVHVPCRHPWRHRLPTVNSHFLKVAMAGWRQRLIPVLTCRISDRSDADLTFIRSSTTATYRTRSTLYPSFFCEMFITSLNFDGKNLRKNVILIRQAVHGQSKGGAVVQPPFKYATVDGREGI